MTSINLISHWFGEIAQLVGVGDPWDRGMGHVIAMTFSCAANISPLCITYSTKSQILSYHVYMVSQVKDPLSQ